MEPNSAFGQLVQRLIDRHKDTTLAERWGDAQNIGPLGEPDVFWVRESDDLINVAWLAADAIFDITWFPDRSMSTLVIVRLRDVTGVEIREAPGAATVMGLPATGDMVVTVSLSPQRSSLLWVGRDEEKEGLRSLALQVASRLFASSSR